MHRLVHVPVRNRTRLRTAISLILLYFLWAIDCMRTEVPQTVDSHANYVWVKPVTVRWLILPHVFAIGLYLYVYTSCIDTDYSKLLYRTWRSRLDNCCLHIGEWFSQQVARPFTESCRCKLFTALQREFPLPRITDWPPSHDTLPRKRQRFGVPAAAGRKFSSKSWE